MIIYRIQQVRPEYTHYMPKLHYLKKEDAVKMARELQAMAGKDTRYFVDSVEVY